MCLWGTDTKSFGQGEVRRRGYLGNVFRMRVEGLAHDPDPKQVNNVKHVVLSLSRASQSSKLQSNFYFPGGNGEVFEQNQSFPFRKLSEIHKNLAENQGGSIKALINTWTKHLMMGGLQANFKKKKKNLSGEIQSLKWQHTEMEGKRMGEQRVWMFSLCASLLYLSLIYLF